MSRLLVQNEVQVTFDVGDRVAFDNPEGVVRLQGIIVRAYADGTQYHIDVNGNRYEADYFVDRIRRIIKNGE